ncbi:tRNA(m5U54)methyltransferase [Microbotryomycetes sp. JL221]|nr:tRNA(m5U54)methyltransferase [Microbotryomycetes sp. JL221]
MSTAPTLAAKRALSRSPSPRMSIDHSAASNAVVESQTSLAPKRPKLEQDDTPNSLQRQIQVEPSQQSTTSGVQDAAAPAVKRQHNHNNNSKQTSAQRDNKKQHKGKAPKPGGVEEVGAFDIQLLLGNDRVEELQQLHSDKEWYKLALQEWNSGADGKNVKVRIVELNSHGEGLALLTPEGQDKPTRLLSVPFTLPGELVEAHIARHEQDLLMSHGDLVTIIEPSEQRQIKQGEIVTKASSKDQPDLELEAVKNKFGQRVQCKYYGRCSGCQYQALSYDDQLEIKRNVVRKAFQNFAKLDPSLVPDIGPTLPSPLQYGYRTKLTPHFEVPPTNKRQNKKPRITDSTNGNNQQAAIKEWQVTIGFEEKGRKRILDIEECPIATNVINQAMTIERQRVKDNIASYKRGATLLLRDSLPPRDASITSITQSQTDNVDKESHVCITDHHATVRERVGDIEFEQKAGSFFQNNNSILPNLLQYVKDAIRSSSSIRSDAIDHKKYLIDAYCGSGLFAISLADEFDVVEGIEIDRASVVWANKNAKFNHQQGKAKIGFREGKAEAIFNDIDFPADQTTVVIDPPRKGCDELFLSQLLKLNPATIVYVSCNVHTQARDIGWLVRESAKRTSIAISNGDADGTSLSDKRGFWIESIRAADLFANTHHAEGVAILRRDL